MRAYEHLPRMRALAERVGDGRIAVCALSSVGQRGAMVVGWPGMRACERCGAAYPPIEQALPAACPGCMTVEEIDGVNLHQLAMQIEREMELFRPLAVPIIVDLPGQ